MAQDGNCKSTNIIYCAVCKYCDKLYVGKTTNALHIRFNGHRSKFYDVIRTYSDYVKSNPHFLVNFEDVSDEQILGIHIFFEHEKIKRTDFDIIYTVYTFIYWLMHRHLISE